ncbi:hypothetical protein C8K30_10317 [Promicromonospora sp. AC04]|uniref:replication initiator n=1 Tax=Promicromonospora sp. AC04 TaxID=2135723 RepID=UPI000D4E32CB|nr:replication initiator [Promicromonospora sp. AC04]PUB28601.1 hypothetical protein C8K30_10317 [Promicromonospora sp. AC04]
MVSFRTDLDTHTTGLDVDDAARAARDLARAGAEANGVCTSPVVRSVFDRETGVTHLVPIPCGSTRESKCKACADKARRLRMHQCREGWHRDAEPDLPPAADKAPAEDDDTEEDDGPASERVSRSTRRLKGIPDLPTREMVGGTLGRTFTDVKTGRRFRPSMFLTLTLGSYGDIAKRRRADGKWESTGVPVNPGMYDYRKAALDALMFSRVVDRFMQNLRRCAGYNVQYFAAVEPQKRLAPHLHAAIRGTIPRAIVKQVAAATYFAAWWPPCTDADVVYGEHAEPPVWDEETANYLDPTTGELLPTWTEATTELENPAHVVRLGKQVDIKGLLGGTKDSDRAVRYLCKYLTKSISGTYAAGDDDAADTASRVAYERHVDRLHAQVKVLPCGPDCANWLRYGVQPKHPTPGMKPGKCLSPAHDRENLGLGGRRVLVSRGWSGKTLTEHRADRAAVVRQALEAAGIEHDDTDRLSTTQETTDGHARYVWREPEAGTYTYAAVITASLHEHLRRRGQYDAAKQALGLAPPGSPGPVDNRSATADLAA